MPLRTQTQSSAAMRTRSGLDPAVQQRLNKKNGDLLLKQAGYGLLYDLR